MALSCSLCHDKIGVFGSFKYLDEAREHIICEKCANNISSCKESIIDNSLDYFKQKALLLDEYKDVDGKIYQVLMDLFISWENQFLYKHVCDNCGKEIDEDEYLCDQCKSSPDIVNKVVNNKKENKKTSNISDDFYNEVQLIRQNTTTIKNCVVFFTVLTVISLLIYVLILLANI